MKPRNPDIRNYFGTALFIALFLLIVVFVSQGSNQPSVPVSPNLAVSEWHSGSTKAILSDAAQVLLIQLNWISVVDIKYIQFFNLTFKQSSDNRKIAQRFLWLSQTELIIKPLLLSRNYYHLFPKGSDIEPVLS